MEDKWIDVDINDEWIDVPQKSFGKRALDFAGGVVETPLSLATGMVGGLAGLVGSIGMSSIKGPKEGEKFREFVSDYYTYKPQTETGRGAMRIAGTLLSPLGYPRQVAQKLGGEQWGNVADVALLGLLPKFPQSIRGVKKAGSYVYKQFPNLRKETIAKQAVGEVSKQLKDIESLRYQSRLEEASKLEAETGVDYTTAQATGSPALTKLERMGMKTGSIDFVESMGAKKAASNMALKQYGDSIVLSGSVDDIIENIALSRKTSMADVNKLVENFSGIDKQAMGITLFNKLKSKATDKYLQAKKLFDVIEKDDPILDADTLVDAVNIYERQNRGLDAVKLIKDKIDKGNISFKDLRDLRTEIGRKYAEQSKSFNPVDADVYGGLLRAVKNTIDETGGLPGKIGKAYNKAKQFYLTEYVAPFRQGASRNILRMGRTGEVSNIPMSDMGNIYFKSGKGAREAAQQFKLALGNDAEAVSMLKGHIERNFYDTVVDVNTGQVNSIKLNTWIKNYNEFFEEFPSIRKEFTQISKAQIKADGILKNTLNVMDKEGNIIAKERIIPSLLNSKNPITLVDKYLNLAKDKKIMKQGLRKGIWDYARETSETGAKDINGYPLLNPDKLAKLRKTNDNLFRRLYTAGELKQIDKFQEAYRILRSTEKSPIGFGSDTVELASTLEKFSGIPMLFSRPVSVTRWIIRNIHDISRGFTETQKAQLMERALYDPETALAFRSMANGASVISTRTKFTDILKNKTIPPSSPNKGQSGKISYPQEEMGLSDISE